ncbi:MAG TPA: hypothetical protein VGC77_03275 [Rhodopseudomonas sp.]|uniref:hypothetical protein n=1 Tax=Rhodopseudomonas sp. TaxID=1078 RepID=UPI002ED812FC
MPPAPLYAADCLTAPSGAAPKGAHWYYRLERETKRQCWYTRAKGAPPTTAVADAEAAPPIATETPAPVAPAPRSLSDARAEYVPTRELTEPSRGDVALPQQATAPASAAASLENQRVAFANRWLERQAAQADPAASPVSDDSMTVADAPAANADVAPAPAAVAGDDSMWMLFAGLAGALGLAGLIAHLVMRFGPSRPIIRREEPLYHDAIYDGMPETPSAAPWPAHAEVAPAASDAIEDEPPPMNWLRIARDRASAAPANAAVAPLLAKAPRPR